MTGEKTCSKCQAAKPLVEFRPNARYAGGHVNWCDPCAKEYRASHYARNIAKVKAQNAAWHEANKESRNAAMKAAYAADPEGHAARVRAARKRSPEQYRLTNKLGARKLRANRADVRLRARISAQLRYCLSTGKGGQTSERLLGYSMTELRSHLERQFVTGMGWGNMTEWHIDHIVPLSSFNIAGSDDPAIRKAWALPNLRPLWAKENIAKGAKRLSLV